MPSVVLQLAARDIASRWVELLAAEPELPSFGKEDWTGKNVIAAMQKLHAALRAKPDAAERLRARVQAADWSNPDKQRLLALIALYAGEDSRYLNFRGPAGSIHTISYAAALSGPSETADAAIGDLSGKVVFVGVSELHSASQADSYDTVYSGLNGINVTGAEIGATAFADLAEGSSPRRPVEVPVVEIVLVAFAIAGAASFGRMLVLLAAGVLVAAAVLVVGWSAFLTEHWLLPVANPLLFQIPVGVLTAAWCFRAEERRRQERMAGAARQYLPQEVVQSLASGHCADRLI